MAEIIDAQGLSCPQPVLLTLEKLKTLPRGEVVVLVDTDTSRENVTRAAESQGWRARTVEGEGQGYRITLAKD